MIFVRCLGRASWVAILAGVTVSVVAGMLVTSALRRGDKIAFQSQAAESFQAIETQLQSANEVLYTLRRFIDLDEAQVSRAAFQAFAKQTRARAPALRDSGFAPRVSDQQRETFETAARRSGWSDFVIRQPNANGPMTPSPRKDFYYPIFFPDPAEVAPVVIGLDLTFEKGRREAIARAVATGQPAATPPVEIVTATAHNSGFMSFLPVFADGLDAPPTGIVYGVFEIAPMLDRILHGELRSHDIDVLFFEPAKRDEVIYVSPAVNRPSLNLPPTLVSMRSVLHWERTLDMSGQRWGVIFADAHVVPAWRRLTTDLTVLSGLVLTALLALYLNSSARRAACLARLTKDLSANTDRLMDRERRLTYLAGHDPLTALANRTTLIEVLNAKLDEGRPGLALITVDLDGFKAVNDTHGHPVGDALLVEVAERLRTLVADHDCIARFGGDEFVLIVTCPDDRAWISDLCRQGLSVLGEPYDIRNKTVCIGASFGVAFARPNCSTSENLLTNADAALYRAKAEGRGTFRFYAPEMDLELQNQLRLEQELRSASARDDFVLHYQPLVAASDNSLVGYEALIRWNHRSRGIISPAVFIPIAEKTGLINNIGAWVFRQACLDAMQWPSHIRLSVNVSAVQFGNELIAVLQDALSASGLQPSRLEIEITETVLIGDSAKALRVLAAIRRLGVRIALDDFGTGYSSLSYLRKFRFDRIKIDQAFVRELRSEDSHVLVRAIVDIAAGLNMSVTAEGIETAEQAQELTLIGCDELQGYFFGRPTTIERLHTRELRAEASAQ